MDGPRDELAAVVGRLAARVQELECRVATLEHRPGTVAAPATSPMPAAPHPLQELASARSGGAMPVVGKVFLGLAGAYLLRAVAESGSIPQLAVVPVALAYAGMWLVWAARTGADARFAATAYGITAALVLAPMLWELTLRFKVLPAGATAGVLAAFVVAASSLAWKRNLAPVAWAATSSAAGTALALLVATRDPVPFTVSLLAMALVTEAAACRDHWCSLRPITALTADLAIVVLVAVYASAEALPPGYKTAAAGVLLALPPALFVIYAGSALTRTVAASRQITFFEIAQTVVAFLLAAWGVLRFTRQAAAPAVGVFSLLAAVACYVAAFARFQQPPRARNYHVFASWAAALILAGTFLYLPPAVLAVWLGLAAAAMTFLGVRSERLTPAFHGALYLAAAAWASGLLGYAAHVLAGAPPAATNLRTWIAAALAVISFAIAWRATGDRWNLRLIRLLFAALAASTLAALAVAGIAWLATGGVGVTGISAPRLAALRTLVMCLAALALAWAGSRRDRVELVWLAYGAMAVCTLKLLLEDLRHGAAGWLAVSLFFYGMVWVLVPCLVRAGTRRPEPQDLGA